MLNSRMINYAKHEEEFYGVLKLINGEEVLGKAVLTDDHGESLCFIQNPVAVEMIEKEIENDRLARGIGFSKWMQLSDEDFYVIREEPNKHLGYLGSIDSARSLFEKMYKLNKGK